MFFKKVFLSIAFLLVAGIGQAQTDADFNSRCSAPGVVTCVGFDNTTSDIVQGQNLHPDSRGTYRAGLDTSIKVSGGGSLRFDLPPPPHGGANIAGRWSPLTNDALGQGFGQNSTFYVQFQQRMSEAMLNNSWDSSWKNVIFHANQTTCGGIELATHNRYSSNLIAMYTRCGGSAMYTTLDGSSHTDSPPMLLQQGDYQCPYSAQNSSNCFYFPANEWVTFYYKISIGTWDRPNSTVEAWIAREGDASYRQFIRVPNMELTCNSATCTSSPGSNEKYNNITFTPYMTGLSSNSGDPGVTAKTWIDELIVSTQPIALPQAGPRPKPPSAFQ